MGIRIEGLGSIEAQLTPQADEKARAGLAMVGEAAVAEIVERIQNDLDARGFKGRIDQGTLWRAITAGEPVKGGDDVWRQETGVLTGGDAEVEAQIAEHGREAGHGISLEGRLRIRKWVERKLGPKIVERRRAELAAAPGRRSRAMPRISRSDRERLIDEVTFLVIRAIRLRGIPGLRPFENTAEHLRRGEAARIFNEAVGAPPE